MLIHLHKQATTTPKVRAAIQASVEPASALAERFGTTEQTIYKWKHRDTVHDRSHTPHRLQTTLTPSQEAVAVVLRKTLLVSLDDLLAVVREFLNPDVSRSGLDRCLRRHGVGNLRDLQAKDPRPKHKAFKAYEPGYLHVDVKYLPQMADETSRRYLFVAIDRATRWVFIRVFKSKTAANARRFLRDLERACPIRIRTILTDNGKEFTDRLFGLRKRAATGQHEFDLLCVDLGIEHRLAPPQHPQTNGMVERFNGRIEEVLQSHHFRSGEELETTLHRYVVLYNQQLPQSALGSKTPLQAMKDWHKLKPEMFRKQPYHLPGCDRYGPMNLFFRHMFLSSAFAIALSLGFSGRVAAQSIDIGLVMDYDNGGVGLQAEYHANPFFERGRFSTRWATAARIDADRDLWAGVGIAANLKLTNSMFVEASIMPGLYHAGETALGSNFEVRSLVGVGAQVSTSKAFILSIDHTSNATTGRLNPGSNAVSLRLRSSF